MNEKIHELRLYLGLSLKSFGEPLGYTGTHIGRFERNAVKPDERLIAKICDAFHVNPRYFTGEMSVEQAVRKANEDEARAEAAQRLMSARQEKGLSTWELSRRTGISQGQISMLERGKYQLKRKAAAKLAEALDVGVDWLLAGDEGKKQYPADRKLVDYLWQHPEVRAELWQRMEEESD